MLDGTADDRDVPLCAWLGSIRGRASADQKQRSEDSYDPTLVSETATIQVPPPGISLS